MKIYKNIVLITVLLVLLIGCNNNHLEYKKIKSNKSITSEPELDLNQAKLDQVLSNSSGLNETQIFGAINKWGSIFLENTNVVLPYMNSMLHDPSIDEYVNQAQKIVNSVKDTEEKINRLNEWSTSRISHTQMYKDFQKLPGYEPWGKRFSSENSVLRKLLPSEMKAMRFRTGKTSAKCYTLSIFLTSIFIKLGVNPDNIIIFQLDMGPIYHAVSLLKFENELILINNNEITLLSKDQIMNELPIKSLGIFNHKFLKNENFLIDKGLLENLLSTKSLLMPAILNYLNIEENYPMTEIVLKNIMHENPCFLTLMNYSLQNIYVPNPDYYLEASLKTSLTKDLAQGVTTINEILKWIKKHVEYGSIFPDSYNRIMLADQVLVFQTGSYKDQAVLAWNLLLRNKIQSEILITEDDAYLKIKNNLYSMKMKSETEKIEKKVILNLGNSANNNVLLNPSFKSKGSIEGRWKLEYQEGWNRDIILFDFKEIEKSIYKCLIHSLRNSKKFDEIYINDIQLNQLNFKLEFETAVKITIEGVYNPDSDQIDGKFIYPDDDSKDFTLVRIDQTHKFDL